MTTQALQHTNQKRDIWALLQSEKTKEQIALALPKHLTPDRMIRVMLTTINRTPKLLECTPESLLAALMFLSQVGLEPDGRHAHLIPYGNQVQVIIDWKGLVTLARRNGVENIAADVVCENDQFAWYRDGDGLHFEHRVDWRKPRGAVYAAYCIWKDGDQFDGEVMTRDEIESIRKRSRAASNGPWVTDWNEMGKKTVVRRASKKWPMDPEALNDDDDGLRPAPTTRPVFVQQAPPQALFSPAAALPAPASDDDGDLGPQAAAEAPQPDAPTPAPEPPKAEPKAKTENPAPARNYVKAIGGLLKLGHHTEAELLEWLRSTGKVDDSLSSLQEVAMVAGEALDFVYNSWAVVDKELKRVKGGSK